MKYIKQALVSFWLDEEAASSVEYALLATFIAAVIISAVRSLGTSTSAGINSVEGAFTP